MITIIFATYNGEKTLPIMLDALTTTNFPKAGFKVIAINNASTDRSVDILKDFKEKLPLKILHQPIRGKNRALNIALPEIQGDLVVFTDDDILPNTDWLIEFKGCADNHPDYDLFGGAILPHWEKNPEPWILDSVPHGVTFALTATDLKEGPIYPGLIWGPNMMVRRRVFEAGHRFNEEVGPNAGQYIMGSETEFNLRIASQGYKTWFCPSSR
jgi:glycosyltransferase involved in cell wall biosynthesis